MNTTASNHKRQQLQPAQPKQNGTYERYQNIRPQFPDLFFLLCKLMDVTPEQVLTDFANNLVGTPWKREERSEARQKLVEYFISHGYGQKHYTPDEIRQIFREMEAMGRVFPTDGDDDIIDAYTHFQSLHEQYFFEKWLNNNKRELDR